MANVIKFVRNNEDSKYVAHEQLNELLHAISPIDGTLCGMQTDMEDGMRPEFLEGNVTCPQCYRIVDGIKKIRNWK